jgi:hypothetical protein
LLTTGVGTPVEILRFAQDDSYKRFGIWNSDLHPRREDASRPLPVRERLSDKKGPVAGRALVSVIPG